MGAPGATDPACQAGREATLGQHPRVLNGHFYLLRTGCAWRYLPREYGSWSTTSATGVLMEPGNASIHICMSKPVATLVVIPLQVRRSSIASRSKRMLAVCVVLMARRR